MDTSGCGPAFGLDGPLAALNTIGILECLEHDGRPTFVIDLDDSTSLDVPSLRPAFCNASLRASKALQNTLFREQSWDGSFNLPGGSTRLDYINWIASSTTLHAVKEDYRSTSFVYLGFAWTHFTVRNRWTLVSGNAFDDSAGALAKRELAATTKPAFTRAKSSRSHSIPKDTLAERPLTQVSRLADWTNFLPLTSHVQFFRDTDWSATSLGPLESWSQELRQMTHFLMSDPRPASMFWGPNKTCMYNESYIPLASNKHPKIMGSTFQEAWPEIYKDFELIFANIERTGQGVNMKDNRLFVHRCGYLEE
ncbi:hypothetical protein MMC13_000632 [Lambiella insularis]|nr:hypothetical protein [Lambiella insularis]